MNQRARSSACSNTRFATPAATTARAVFDRYDLARSPSGMQHEEYLRLARLPRLSIATLDAPPHRFPQHQRPDRRYDGALD